MPPKRYVKSSAFMYGIISAWDILGANNLDILKRKPLYRRYRDRSLRNVMMRDLRKSHNDLLHAHQRFVRDKRLEINCD